jgi:DNA-binding NarL/FixJ family response regulator
VINVAIFDSHPVFLLGLTDVLTAAGYHVIESSTSLTRWYSLRTHLFVVDVEVVAAIDAVIPELSRVAPVLLVASPANAPELAGYLRAGAAGLVDRRDSPEVLLAAVQAAVAQLALAPRPVDGERGRTHLLSSREKQVLRHIASGLTHGQVARLLGISPHTVDTYVKRIRSKLDLGNKAELTRAAMEDAGLAAGTEQVGPARRWAS